MNIFTDKEMQAKPTDKDQWLSRPFKRGAGVFVGRITTAGERLLYFRYTDSNGKRRSWPIGAYHPKSNGGLTLDAGYRKAMELSTLYSSGVKNLHQHFAQELAEKQAQELRDREQAARERQAAIETAKKAELDRQRRLTMRQLFERWASVDLKSHTGADGKRVGRVDGGEYTKQQFERHIFNSLGDVAAVDVKKADLLAILDERKAAGTLRTANVLLADLKQMFNFAVQRDIMERNPLDGIEKRAIGGKDVERDRVLSDDEIRQLKKQLPASKLQPRSEIAIWAILSTACRLGELMSARWDDIDFVARTWRIPPEKAKNQREHVVHLSEFAFAQFTALHNLRTLDKNGQLAAWVFPAKFAEESVCVKSFGKQLADRQRPPERRMKNRTAATAALNLKGGRWTAHDLRRTAATLMARMGVSSDVIDECLNHIIRNKVTRVYIRDRRESEQARAFDALGRKLSELVTGQTSKVVELRAA